MDYFEHGAHSKPTAHITQFCVVLLFSISVIWFILVADTDIPRIQYFSDRNVSGSKIMDIDIEINISSGHFSRSFDYKSISESISWADIIGGYNLTTMRSIENCWTHLLIAHLHRLNHSESPSSESPPSEWAHFCDSAPFHQLLIATHSLIHRLWNYTLNYHHVLHLQRSIVITVHSLFHCPSSQVSKVSI